MALVGREKMTNKEYNDHLFVIDDILDIEEDLQRVKSLYGNRERRLIAARSAQYKLDILIKFLGGTEDGTE